MGKDELLREIDDLLAGFDGGEQVNEEEKEEPAAQDEQHEPEEGAQQEPAEESTEEGKEEEGEGEEETSEEEEEEEEEPEDVEDLRRKLDELAAAKLGEGKEEEETEEDVQAPSADAFISEDEFEKVLTDSSALNDVLHRVYERAFKDAVNHVAKQVPVIVNSIVNSQLTLHSMVQEFYTKNPDLLPYRKFVGWVANQLQAQHPDWELQKLFGEVEKEVRKALKLTKSEGTAEQARRRPAFAKAGGARPGKAPEIPQELKEMLELLE